MRKIVVWLSNFAIILGLTAIFSAFSMVNAHHLPRSDSVPLLSAVFCYFLLNIASRLILVRVRNQLVFALSLGCFTLTFLFLVLYSWLLFMSLTVGGESRYWALFIYGVAIPMYATAAYVLIALLIFLCGQLIRQFRKS